MAMLKSLVDYYEILCQDENSTIPRLGYSSAKVFYALNISDNGELLNIISLKILNEKNKEIAIPMIVPQQEKRASGVSANFLCDNSSYVLGHDNKGKPERSKKCFEAFCELHKTILSDIDCREAKAVLAFLDNWDINTVAENSILSQLSDAFTEANFIFKLDGENRYIHECPEIRNAWMQYKNTAVSNELCGICLVTGEKTSIARLHPSLKGLNGGKSTGNTLVSFNAPAYESYGNVKSQGLNAPISDYAAFAYTTVLNTMLSDKTNKINLGDSNIVFWAQSKISKSYNEMFAYMIQPDEKDNDNLEEKNTIKCIKGVFEKVRNGEKINSDGLNFDDVRFSILALSPNAARVSVRFYLENSFYFFIEKMAKHYRNMAIEKQFPDKEPDSISIWRILNETVAPSSRDKSASPLLAGSVMQAILNGTKYPSSLFSSLMMRIRADRNINYVRASTIKAYLIRFDFNKYQEVLTMSLNSESTNTAYVLGRLFAVLEKTQLEANPGINTTIKDRYFTSACANPSLVFPQLLKLSNHHIAKAEYGKSLDKRISEVLEILNVNEDPFPKNLSLESQGVFILGYYHQKNTFYKKKED